MLASAATPRRLLLHLLLPSRPHLPHQNPSFCFPYTPSPARNVLIPQPRTPLAPLSASPSEVPYSEAAGPPPPPRDGFDSDSDPEPNESEGGDGVEVEVTKVGRNRRRILARVGVDAGMEVVWAVLTDYEGLAGFIPGLAVSRLVEKGEGFARLYQVGQQDLALGLKFQAKGILDCFEKDLEILPSGRRRDIEFKMVDGDFQTFEGAWSILQTNWQNLQSWQSSASMVIFHNCANLSTMLTMGCQVANCLSDTSICSEEVIAFLLIQAPLGNTSHKSWCFVELLDVSKESLCKGPELQFSHHSQPTTNQFLECQRLLRKEIEATRRTFFWKVKDLNKEFSISSAGKGSAGSEKKVV